MNQKPLKPASPPAQCLTMGPTKKRSSSSRASKKAERDLLKKFVALGMESSSRAPVRERRPERPSTSKPYVEEPRYRKLLDYLIKSAMSQFGLIDYVPPEDLSLGDYFPMREFVKMFKITFILADLSFVHWKEFFRKNYRYMMSGQDSYLQDILLGLKVIYSRDRPFYENLLAAHSFVFCATVYFCYNGWQPALKHPFRILACHFEDQLRTDFARAGGFRGLAEFCENHEMLKMYEFYCERSITPENRILENDVKPRLRIEVGNIMYEYDKELKNPKCYQDLTINAVFSWVKHVDLDVKQKRIVGNEWKYKDIHLATTLLKFRAQEQEIATPPARETNQEADEKDSAARKPPIIDEEKLETLKKVLKGFNTSLFELEKTAESLVEW